MRAATTTGFGERVSAQLGNIFEQQQQWFVLMGASLPGFVFHAHSRIGALWSHLA